jgi:hypothetical protein
VNNYIWIALILLAWTRPIDIYMRVRHPSGLEVDYIKTLAWIIATALIIIGVWFV